SPVLVGLPGRHIGVRQSRFLMNRHSVSVSYHLRVAIRRLVTPVSNSKLLWSSTKAASRTCKIAPTLLEATTDTGSGGPWLPAIYLLFYQDDACRPEVVARTSECSFLLELNLGGWSMKFQSKRILAVGAFRAATALAFSS